MNLFIFNKHLIFAFFAFFIMIFLSSLEVKTIRRLSLFSIIFFIIILLIILFFDYEINGSKRWLKNLMDLVCNLQNLLSLFILF